jgi:serine/threonine protein kinase
VGAGLAPMSGEAGREGSRTTAVEEVEGRGAIVLGRADVVEGRWIAVNGVTSTEPFRYRIVGTFGAGRGELGRGGIGRVLRAFDERLGREVALKELLPPPNGRVDQRLEEMFLREARIAGRLEHPHVIPIYDVGRGPDGRPFFTMKLVRGPTLAEALDSCPTLVERMLLLPHVVDVGNALAHAHSRGVIHCDLKPENVMIGEFGETVLLDWGLAVARGLPYLSPELAGEKWLRTASFPRGSSSGRILGTPAYLSPEQAEGRLADIDERTDVWGLGAILYELLTGWPPFHAGTPTAALAKLRSGVAPDPVLALEPLAPPALAAAADRALRRDGRSRFATVRHLVAALESFLPIAPHKQENSVPVIPLCHGSPARPGRFSLPVDGRPWRRA